MMMSFGDWAVIGVVAAALAVLGLFAVIWRAAYLEGAHDGRMAERRRWQAKEEAAAERLAAAPTRSATWYTTVGQDQDEEGERLHVLTDTGEIRMDWKTRTDIHVAQIDAEGEQLRARIRQELRA